jgi:hypothetical protein
MVGAGQNSSSAKGRGAAMLLKTPDKELFCIYMNQNVSPNYQSGERGMLYAG